MSNNKKYWKGVEELNDTPDFQLKKSNEFNEYLPAEDFLGDEGLLSNSNTSRRDFLKYLGFGVTAASLAACETPVNKVIPYVVKSDKTNPGVANYFATHYYDGFDYCDIVVKTREGRPIKIEGNKKSPYTQGAINARVNSSVLSLYDEKRFKSPQIDGEDVSWAKFNEELKGKLSEALANGGKVRFLTNSITSPSTLRMVGELVAANPEADIKHVNYDAVSFSSILEANESSFGKRAVPSYQMHKAKVIVGIGADFLNSYPSSLELTKQYAIGRNPENKWMSKHYQVESSLSLTGSNADSRLPVKPSEQSKVVLALYNNVASMTGGQSLSKVSTAYDEKIKKIAADLVKNAGESLVLSGSTDTNTQILVNAINNQLGNYGKTLDLNVTDNTKKGVDSEVVSLIKEMQSGSVDYLAISDVNPSYSLPTELGFEEALTKVKTAVVFASRPNATTSNAKYIAAVPHYLESWNDSNPKTGHYSIMQPTITPLFDTMQFQDCMLNWMGSDLSYYDYIKQTWEQTAFSLQSKNSMFEDFWNNCLHEGYFVPKVSNESASLSFNGDLNAAASAVSKSNGGVWELEFYIKVGIGEGSQSHNPWLQELPDPISKMTWDNYIAMNPSDAREQGFATEYGEQKNADTVNITINGIEYNEVPVIAQPGQAKGSLSVALGYGQSIGKQNEIIGFNFYSAMNGMNSMTSSVSFEATGNDYQVATTQTHQTVMGRDSVVRESDWSTFKNGSKDDFNPAHMLATHDGPMNVNDVDLWASHPVAAAGHHWGMSIDLNSCIGCGSCVTSCNSENNVPVVGKDEVRRSREMHWIRIDRYFSSAEEKLDEGDRSYTAMEMPEDNPMVVHQPMMCQHCNHAPCETVCPVAATTHSNEGLNQMTYNRCIGTRYCANNCPYKVRRFNWFSYQNYDKFADLNPAQDDLGRMVLNPDVTVRARGVMEKCSMCVQRIQTGKLDAKKEGRSVIDGEIETACSSACPTNAITFGDLNDKSSKVLERSKNDRAYRVIEEVGTQANVYYQIKVRNTENNLA